jgi:hypothetical protein
MTKKTSYRLRDTDVKNALKVINKSSTSGEMFEALRTLLGHAEEIPAPISEVQVTNSVMESILVDDVKRCYAGFLRSVIKGTVLAARS